MAGNITDGIEAGTTSFTTNIVLRGTDGLELAGKVAADVTAYYWRQGGTPTAISLSDLASINSAWTAGGFKEAEGTNMKGSYRLDLPNAALAAGADWVELDVFCSGSYLFKRTWPITTETDDLTAAIQTATTTITNAITAAGGAGATPAMIADAVAARVIETEGAITLQQALSIMLAVLAGLTEPGGLTFKTPNGQAVRLVGVEDAQRTRTASTLTPSA
jgi:hypothetical protein